MMQDHVTLLNRCAEHCLTQIKEGRGDVKRHAVNHEHLMDCAAICSLTAQLMVRESPLSKPMHAATAACCETAAGVLEKSADNAAVMAACVKSARECAAVCRQMA